MAKTILQVPITGSMGDYSVYRMKGSPKLIVRAKSGPTKMAIKKGPQYSQLRQFQSEFSGCGKGISQLMNATHAMKHLADHNYSGNFTKACKAIQKLDMVNPQGKRSILFSKYGSILAGFDFNLTNPFDSIVKQPIEFTISRNNLSAQVEVGDLYPEINFLNPWKLPRYRLILGLGIVSDMKLTADGYTPATPLSDLHPTQERTEWMNAAVKSETIASAIRLEIPAVLKASSLLVLTIGVEFGRLVSNNLIEAVKRAGTGKILGVG